LGISHGEGYYWRVSAVRRKKWKLRETGSRASRSSVEKKKGDFKQKSETAEVAQKNGKLE